MSSINALNTSSTSTAGGNTSESESTIPIKAHVAGIMFEERFVYAQELTLSHPLRLIRQPDNAHDPNAIQVVQPDIGQIGFLPRQMAAVLASRMDAHQATLPARVIDLHHEPASEQVRVQIEFHVPQSWLALVPNPAASVNSQIVYHVETRTDHAYLLLNCNADQMLNIRDILPANKFAVMRSGYSTWPAQNGRQYEWYIKLDSFVTSDSSKLAQLLERRFSAISDEQKQNQLDELTRNYQREVALLDDKLRLAEQEKREAWHLGTEAEAGKQKEIDQLKQDLSRLKADHDSLKQQAFELRQTSDNLNVSLFSREAERVPFGIEVERTFLKTVADSLTPYQSLEVVQTLFPDRLVVLPTAFKSATESEHFQHRARLFGLLWKLAKEYWPRLINNQGITEAQAIFGDDFALNESESTRDNPTTRRERTFIYKGQAIEMMKHLKIGVRHDTSTTIRVHFEWVADERKIVIGHCGPHLTTAGS